MKIQHRLVCSLLALGLIMLCAIPALAGKPERILINITTDDVNRAAMAISLAHNAMKVEGLEGALFFTVEGVHLVDRTKPSPIYPTGASIAAMLKDFMRDGGTVIACPMCMKNVGGMTNADLMDGVQSKKGMGLKAVVAPDTLVMTY